MVTIETENGRFEADTIKAAEKLANQAARKAAKAEKERAALREHALILARAEAYGIMVRKARDSVLPCGWRFFTPEEKNASTRLLAGEFDRSCRLSVETEHGRAEHDFYGFRFLGHVENGAGWTTVVALQDRDGAHEVTYFAVGVHAGELGLAEIPALTSRDFRQRGEDWEAYKARVQPTA